MPNLDQNAALAHSEYATRCAYELLDNAYTAYIYDNHLNYETAPDIAPTTICAYISLDELESLAHAIPPLFPNDLIFDMILTYELICAKITNITDCPYHTIAANS